MAKQFSATVKDAAPTLLNKLAVRLLDEFSKAFSWSGLAPFPMVSLECHDLVPIVQTVSGQLATGSNRMSRWIAQFQTGQSPIPFGLSRLYYPCVTASMTGIVILTCDRAVANPNCGGVMGTTRDNLDKIVAPIAETASRLATAREVSA